MLFKFFLLLFITLTCQAQSESAPQGEERRPIKIDIPALTKILNISFGEYQLTDHHGASAKEKCFPEATIRLEHGPDGIDLWIGGTPFATNLEHSVFAIEAEDYGEQCQTTLYTALEDGLISQKSVRKCGTTVVTSEFKLERLASALIKMSFLDVHCFYSYSAGKSDPQPQTTKRNKK